MNVMIFGTFDHLHEGHRFLIREAMKRGDVRVIVGRDANVEKIKGRVPRQSEQERSSTIQKEFPDVHVVLGNADDFLEPLRLYKPDLLFLGYDQQLPPGISESDLSVPIERAEAFEPERYKSSLML
jgi:FAD synthetase